ncbi:MAG: carboxypeptidase regulatory-like domain-containing protein [Nitrospirae bacterium]|nr:carboxypeptidase regulatory-like domain-containing protein [Nitrospirota bacterium]
MAFRFHLTQLGLAHSISTAPVLPAGITRIPKGMVMQRAYELTEAGLRIKLGEPVANSVYGLLEDWNGGNAFDKGFDDILRTMDAGADFLSEAQAAKGNYQPADTTSGPKLIAAMQLPEADNIKRGRVVALLFDKKISVESANNPAAYKLLYRTDTRALKNLPKNVKVLPGRRIIEVYFQSTVSPFFDYDLVLSGIKGLNLKPQEPEPARIPVITTLTEPGGIISGTVRKGDGSPIPHTEVFLNETFRDDEGYGYTVVTNRTVTDSAGTYRIDYVIMGSDFSVSSSDPETGQQGSMSSRIIMDRQHLKLDILLLGLGTLTGQVIKAEDQSPVWGATVTAGSLTTSGTYGAVTDSKGRFTLRMVPVGNLNLSAEDGTSSGSISARILSAGGTTDVTIPIYSHETATGSVNGRVFENDSRTPVPGVPVMIGAGGYGNWQYSDNEGRYSFERVPAGGVKVNTFRQSTGEQAQAEGTVLLNLPSTINLVLPGTGAIVGTVYNHKYEPVAGAEVIAGITLVVTDKNGNFTFDKVPMGRTTLSAAVPNTPDVGSADVQIGSPGEVVRVNIILTHNSKGTIQGYVKDSHGNPAGYQNVIIWDGVTTPVTTMTDSAGFFRKELDLGGYTIRIVNNAGNDGDMKSANLVLDGQTITLNLRFNGLGRVTGVVYLPDGVSPTVANVYITRTYYTGIGSPYMQRERFISDQPTQAGGPSGRFIIENVPLGSFRLEASSAFYSQPVVRTGQVTTQGETVNLDIVLTPTSTVRGQVFLASGDRAGAGLAVNLTPSNTSPKMRVFTKDDGTFQFDLVPPTGFTLDVYDSLTGNYGVARGGVETGDDAELDISILGKGTVKVHVINGSGDPVPNSRVQINSGSPIAYLLNGFPKLTTNASGEAVFTNIPEGNFSVTAQDPFTLTGGRSGGIIPEDLTEVSVTVVVSASGDVKGTVYIPEGTGTVPYAQVKLLMGGRPPFYTTTDSDGAYLFDYVPLGAFKLEVFHPGTGRWGRAAGAVNFDTEEVEVDVRLIGQGTVEGYVYTASGAAVSKARVSITSNEFGGTLVMTSNLEGRFRASGIPEGNYTVSAYDDGRKISGSAGGKIISEGEEVKTDVYLEATGTIYGRVFAANRTTPIAYAQVSLSGPRSGNAVTDSEGNFSFSTLTLGAYQLTAREQTGFDAGRSSATLSYEGQMSNSDIVFIGTSDVTGRVVRADGEPLGKPALLALTKTGLFGGTFSGYSDLDGNFGFYGIPSGNISISAKLSGTLLGGLYSGTLSGDGGSLSGVIITIEDSGDIFGTVLRQDGATPCKDAVITCTLVTPDGRSFTIYATAASDGSFSFRDIPFGRFTLSVYDYFTTGIGKASGVLSASPGSVTLAPILLDEMKPFVISVVPASGASQAPLNSVIMIEFSEPVDPSTVNTSNIRVTGGPNAVAGILALGSDRKTVTFTPSSGLPEFTSINVTVRNILDDAGQQMPTAFSATFTSADVTAPTVLSARMIKGNFVVEISEAVISGSGVFSVRNTATGALVSGALTYSSGNAVVTLYPSAALPDGVVFELSVSGFKDSFGNTQAGEFRATYLTGDKVPPVMGLAASPNIAIEGTPVTVTAAPDDASDLYTVDFRVNGVLAQTLYKAPYSIIVKPSATATVTAVGTDYAGNMGPEASVTITVVPNAAPSAAIISPADGTTLGTGKGVTVRVLAADDLGLKELELRVRSQDISQTQVYRLSPGALTATHDFSFSIPSASMPGNDIRVEAVSRDIRGLESPASVIVLHTEDKTLPVAQITSFTRTFHVRAGQTVPVNVYASDNQAIRRVDFRTEGGFVVSDYRIVEPPTSDVVAQFSLTIPANYSGGTKVTVAPFATDVAGNIGYAPKITLITDDVTLPTVELVSPADGTSVLSRAQVKVTARASDNDSVDRVEFYVDGKPFAADKVPSGGLYDASFIAPAADGTSVNVSVKSFDSAGNASQSADVNISIAKDTVAPTVTLAQNPSSMKFTEGHNVNIGVNAGDNIGVASVRLIINNVEVGAFDNPSSGFVNFTYLVERLIPQGSANISVPLEVRAVDFDGNPATTGVYTITLTKDIPAVVTIATPLSGQELLAGSRVHIEAKATDDYGIKSLEIKVNGVSLSKGASASLSADYELPVTAIGTSIAIEAYAVDTMDQGVSTNAVMGVPMSMTQVSGLATGGEVIDAALHNGYAYALEKGDGISVIDIRDSASPVKVSTLSLPGDYAGLEIFEKVVYVYGLGGVAMVDTVNPASPAVINHYATSARVLGMAFRAGYAYGALGTGGLLIMDTHDPLSIAGVVLSLSEVKGVKADGDYLYISHGSTNPALDVYSLSDPLIPVKVASYATGPVNLYDTGSSDSGSSIGIGITGSNRLTSFGFNGSALSRYSDITLSKLPNIKAVDLMGRYVFVSSGADGWGVVKAAADGGLFDLGSIISAGGANRIIPEGGYVYSAAGTAGFRIYRISTTNAITPQVQITSPASGTAAQAGGELEVRADVINGDNASVIFYINGEEVFKDDTAPYAYRFRAPIGQADLVIKAKASNLYGLTAESEEITLNVTADTAAPTLALTSPLQGSLYTLFEGDILTVKGTAADNLGLKKVELFVNGALAGSTILPSFEFKYTVPDDGATGTDYQVPVMVRATDVSGNVVESGFNLRVIQDNPPVVSFISPQSGTEIYSGAPVSLSVTATDDRSVKEVKFHEGGNLLGTGVLSAGNVYSLASRAPAVTQTGTRTFRAVATDSAGLTSEASVNVTILKDNVLPVVVINSDLASMRFTEGHSNAVSVTASDNAGVSSVELVVNNKTVAAITNPATSSLTLSYLVENLIPQGQGSISVPLEVRATDRNGNIGTSGVRAIEIFPDLPPVVTVLSPLAGQNVLGGASIRLNATATDDFGVASMELKVNGISLLKKSGDPISADYTVPASALGSVISIEAIATDTLGKNVSKTIVINVPLKVGLVSSVSTGGEIIDAAFNGGYVYTLDKGVGVSVIDVRDATLPNKVGALPLAGSFSGLRIFEGVAYVYGTNGVTPVDLSDPALPKVINTYTTPTPVLDITFRNGYAYCAMGSGGLLILDVHNPQALIGTLGQ